MQKLKIYFLIICLSLHRPLFDNCVILSEPTTATLLNQHCYLQKKYTAISDYYNSIKCIARSLYFLSILDKQHYCYRIYDCEYENNCIQIDGTRFFNLKVKSCIQKIWMTQSLKPIIALLHQTKKHYSHNDTLIREIFLLIFIIHKQIILEKYKENPQAVKKIDLETIIELSNKINQLPIAEVLNAIDMLITELPPFLEKYEFNSQVSWKEWFKKYWWVPPICGGWFCLKILVNLQRPHYYFSPYLHHRPSIPLSPITTNDPVLGEIIVESTIYT